MKKPKVVEIIRGDDTGAFGKTLLTITVGTIPEGWNITKVVFYCGRLQPREFINPTFPIPINFTSEQTKNMDNVNECTVALYDNDNLKQTCTGHLVILVKDPDQFERYNPCRL